MSETTKKPSDKGLLKALAGVAVEIGAAILIHEATPK